MIAGILKTAMNASRRPSTAPPTPTPPIVRTLAPRPRGLIDDYLRHVGADPAHYRGVVPAHLWPQWGFPLAADTLADVPYVLTKVLNGGCRLEIAGPIPDDEPLVVSAWLDTIDDDGKRAILTQKVVTGTRSAPGAVTATLTAFVPLVKREGPGREKPTVPTDARELARYALGPDAGWRFAVLTGDFNPVHWVRPWARAMGFRSTILHGFATMARTIATLDRVRFAGDPSRLAAIDVRFPRPLVLPAEIGVYLRGDEVCVGTHPGGPAFMSGTVRRRDE
jgi:hypothetical protein